MTNPRKPSFWFTVLVSVLSMLIFQPSGLTQTVYYFSSSKGNDGNTPAQAQKPASPWQSLQKLNQIMPGLQPGDKILFMRGDKFDGSFRITRSGSASRPIVFSSYGTGKKPVINGLAEVTNWTNFKNNIWQAILNGSDRLNMVMISGKVLPMGRYPNAGAANGGYLAIEGHDRSGFDSDRPHNSSVTSSQVPAQKTNWTGAEICIRPVRWMLNWHQIVQHAGNNITYSNAQYEPANGFGFFIQNDLKTLDERGEWYYNGSAHQLNLYNPGNPDGLQVQASMTDTLVTIVNQRFLVIDGLNFTGANQIGIYAYKGSDITIQNCVVSYSGDNGINSDQTTRVVLDRDTVLYTNNNAIYIAPFANNGLIQNCVVRVSGMVAGFGRNGNQAREAIVLDGNRSEVRYCRVDSIGYNGIVTANDSSVIRNNLVSNFNLLFDDGAGIYTSGRGKGRRILNNIIINGPGNQWGTNAGPELNAANGIGLDDLSEDVVIDGNSVANCSREGVGLHNSKNVRITNNTFYNVRDRSIGFLHDNQEPNNPIRDVTIRRNIFFATGVSDMLTRFDTRRDFSDLTQFGQSDSNYWARPFNPTSFFGVSYVNGSGQRISQTYDFASWQKVFRQDIHSVQVPVSLPAFTFSGAGANKFPAGNFQSVTDIVRSNQPNLKFTADRTHLDNGCLQISSTDAGGANQGPVHIWFIDFSRLETFQAGKSYRVRFSVQGQAEGEAFAVLIRGSNPALTDPQSGKLSQKRTEVDMIFTPAQNIEHAWVELTFERKACPVWIDNLQIQEVTGNRVRASDYFRFEYNASTSQKTISLPGEYTDLKGKAYRNSVQLAPFTSVVLMKKGVMKGK